MAMAFAACLTLGAAPSFAADPPEDARTFFAEGRRLRLAGDCVAAIAQFQLAREAYPEGLGSLRNIAQCQEELGQVASARRTWWTLRTEALGRGEKRYDDWEKDAVAAYERLADRVPTLKIVIRGPRDDLRIAVDGKDISLAMIDEPLERDPGLHHVVVTRGGASLFEGDVQLRLARRETVTVDVPPSTGGPPSPGAKADRGPGWIPIAGYTSLGLGVASFIGMGVAAGVRLGALSELEERCPDYETGFCPPGTDVASTVSRGDAATAATNVLAVVGSVTTALGITLVVVDAVGDGEAAGDDTPGVGLVLTPGGLTLRGRF